jgi:hypothetical protein
VSGYRFFFSKKIIGLGTKLIDIQHSNDGEIRKNQEESLKKKISKLVKDPEDRSILKAKIKHFKQI